MTVAQIIDMAANGELANIATKNDNDKILSYINLGLIELYKRFPLKVEEALITLKDGKDIYTIGSTDPDVQLSGTGDYMWLVAAYGEVPDDSELAVQQLPINEEDNPLSINTVGWNKVQIPLSVAGAYVSLIYAASPEYVTSDMLDSDIALPPQMIEALLHYVGYRAHAAMDGNIQAENNTHYTRFEASCARIKTEGMLTNDDLNMNPRYSGVNSLWV